MVSRGEKRNSSLDLLKIIGMLFIIAHHYYVHGGFAPVSVENMNKGRIFLEQVSMYGSWSCDLFALITGFYMIESKDNGQKRLKKIMQLVVEIYFYALVIFAALVYRGLAVFSFSNMLRVIFPILWGNWYIIAYLLFYLLVPYINPLLNQLSEKEYRRLLVILFICWSVIPTLTQLDKSWEFSNVDFFVVMYAFGGYYRLHIYGKRNHANAWNALVGMICFGIAIGSVRLCDYVGIKWQNNSILGCAQYLMPLYSSIGVIWALSWFAFFANIHFYSRFVTYIAGSVFGIYMIHENDFLRPVIWTIWKPNSLYADNPYVHFFEKLVVIFAGCLLVDMLRRLLFWGIQKIRTSILGENRSPSQT